ncbi:transposase [Bradyrhizobium ottawaense]|uniref:transposase n=1 Tax=Bradyrhizobium ottawaense TaxID=931866 RepID=UPI0035124A66
MDARGFKSARNLAAWLGLKLKNRSTAGKNRLGLITRAGDSIKKWLERKTNWRRRGKADIGMRVGTTKRKCWIGAAT